VAFLQHVRFFSTNFFYSTAFEACRSLGAHIMERRFPMGKAGGWGFQCRKGNGASGADGRIEKSRPSQNSSNVYLSSNPVALSGANSDTVTPEEARLMLAAYKAIKQI